MALSDGTDVAEEDWEEEAKYNDGSDPDCKGQCHEGLNKEKSSVGERGPGPIVPVLLRCGVGSRHGSHYEVYVRSLAFVTGAFS